MPVSREQKLKYEKVFRALMKKAQRIPDDAARELLLLLRDYRKEVIDIIVSATGWNAYYLTQIKKALEDVTEQLTREMSSSIVVNINKSWETGTNLIDMTFKEIGLVTPPIGFGMEDLYLARNLAADLVTDLGDYGRQSIMREIQRGLLGQRSQIEVAKAIGKVILKDTARQGAPQSTFKTLANRTEAIARTETARVMNAGHAARMKSAAEEYPETRKYWVATWDSRARAHHLQADQDTNYTHGGKPIGVDDKFTVGGHKCDRPGDPGLPPEESVNCRCLVESTMLTEEDMNELYPNSKVPFAISTLKDLKKRFREGGPGSGYFGHAGRPGEVGGSLPKGVNKNFSVLAEKLKQRIDYAKSIDAIDNYSADYIKKYIDKPTYDRNIIYDDLDYVESLIKEKEQDFVNKLQAKDFNRKIDLGNYIEASHKTEDAIKLISEEEKAALALYTGMEYSPINRVLRGVKLENITLNEKNIYQKRADLIESALNKLPSYNGESFRSIGFFSIKDEREIYNSTFKNLKPGDVFIDKGFLSTTHFKDVANSFGSGDYKINMRIKSKTGKIIENLSKQQAGKKEFEILFNRNTKFIINSHYKEKNSYGQAEHYVEMEEI